MSAVQGAGGPEAGAGRVQFADVDMHGNLHNSRMLAIAEAAIDEALLAAGADLAYDPATAETAFVVKRAAVEYSAPLRYRDRYACALRTVEVGAASVTFTVDVHRLGAQREPAASASVVWVFVNVQSKSPVRIPRDLAERLKAVLVSTDS